MKTSRILPCLSALAVVTYSGGLIPAATAPEPNQIAEIQGLPCQGKVDFFANGKIRSCSLARDHPVMGQLLPAGSRIFFTDDGRVRECLLGRQATLYGQLWPAHSRLWPVDRLGRIRFWPGQDMLIHGYVCKAVDDGVGHYLYAGGKLCAIWLKETAVIDGVPCTSSTSGMPLRVSFFGIDRMAWFHENGHLRQGLLARDCTLQGHAFKKGDVICLNPEGGIDLTAKTIGADSRGPRGPGRPAAPQ